MKLEAKCKDCFHYNKGMCHKDPKNVKFVNPNDNCRWEKENAERKK